MVSEQLVDEIMQIASEMERGDIGYDAAEKKVRKAISDSGSFPKSPKNLNVENANDMMSIAPAILNEMQLCRMNPHHFTTTYMTVNGKPFATRLSESQFNELVVAYACANSEKHKAHQVKVLHYASLEFWKIMGKRSKED